MTPAVSVVIPAYNEAESVGEVVAQTAAVLRRLGHAFEIIVVNDGSLDETSDRLRAVAGDVPQCRELRLEAHAGQGAALLAGLAEARARWIVTLDGDGQNDPADIPAVLEPVIAGEADMMCGWRWPRADGWVRMAMSKVANTVRRRLLHDRIHDAGCQLRAFRREVIAAIRPMELVQSFLPALASAAGFRVSEVRVRHHPRRHGQSKYGLRRLWWRPARAMLQLRHELRQIPKGRAS